MIESDKKIRKGLGPKREVPCLLVERDIVIPAGTMLRQSEPDKFEAQVGDRGKFSIYQEPHETLPGLKRVIST